MYKEESEIKFNNKVLCDYVKTKNALIERCNEIANKFVSAKIMPPEYAIVDVNDILIDTSNREIDMYIDSISSDTPRRFPIHISFDIFCSDEKIDKEIEKRKTILASPVLNLEDLIDERVYIAGKMTGLSMEEIQNRFKRVEDILVKKNAVMNPAVMWNLADPSKFDRDQYLEICYSMIDICDTIVVLPEFEDSYGTQKEIAHAEYNNKDVYYLGADDDKLYTKEPTIRIVMR